VIPARRTPFLLADALGLALLLFTWYLGRGGMLLLAIIVVLVIACELACRFLAAPGMTPYMAMLAAPLLLVHYSSIHDFRVRLACFAMLLAILALAWRQPRLAAVRLRPVHAWLLSLLAFSLAAVVLHAQGIHLSGDEPHYVMIAQSLVEDGDFDLKNNIEEKTYFSYLPVEVRFHGSIHDGRWHSFHLPGVSLLLLPFYLLFKLLAGAVPGPLFFRLAAAVINSFFALGLFLALQRLTANKRNDGIFLFFLLTFPLLFHAVHLFPELPAATLVIFAYLAARDKRNYFISGLLLAGVPWLHLKYALPTLVLALFVASWIRRENRGAGARWRQLAAFVAAPALSLALLGLYSRLLYGSFDPRAISPEKNFLAIPLKFQVETLLSFFLDQRDGLLLYAPLFLLVFLVFKKEVRSGIRDFALLTTMAASYILFHAITTVRGAYSPAARPTLFVLWIMAVFLAALHDRSRPGLRALIRLLAGLTAFASAWFVYYPLFLYQPVTREVSQRASSWLAFMSSDVLDLPAFFPSFLKKSNSAWAPNWAWLLLLACALALYYSRDSWPLLRRVARPAFLLLGLGLLVSFCWFPHVRLQTRYRAAGLSFFCNSKNFAYRTERSAFRAQAGRDYDLFFDLKGSAADRLDLSFSGDEPIGLRVRNGRQLLLAAQSNDGRHLRLSLRQLNKFSLGKRELVHIGLETAAGGEDAALLLKLK
jgi:hypothetical protein